MATSPYNLVKVVLNYGVSAVERARDFAAIIEFDEESRSPFYNYFSLDGVPHVVWFDDGRSMNEKLRLIADYNLKGGAYWQIMKFFPQNWLVVNSIFNIIKKV